MTDLVDATLRDWRRGAHVYGESDCMLSIGKYLAAAGARDITELGYGKYSDEAGAHALLRALGGASALIDATGAAQINDSPQRGDVLALEYGEDDIGALCTGDRVAVRLDRGVVEVPLRFVRWRGAWRPWAT